jgi:hypothetical protein
MERWRVRCRESYQERCRRQAQLALWDEERSRFLFWSRRVRRVPDQAPQRGWVLTRERVFGPRGRESRIVEAWVPRHLGDDRSPYQHGPLPLSRCHRLSLADFFFILALLHDHTRRDGGRRINPFDPDAEYEIEAGPNVESNLKELEEACYWQAQLTCLNSLESRDQATIDDAVAHVERDLAGPADEAHPTWDAIARRLMFRGLICKQYRKPARDQEKVLAAFEEESWPPAVLDPLERGKLGTTVDSLNDRLQHIRFRRNGSGTSIYWSAL